jgi:hypothetical protein
MITTTSINLSVVKKLFKAMRAAQSQGIAHVYNRKGHAFLAVRKIVTRGKVFFQVLDKNGNNLKGLIAVAVIRLMFLDIVTPSLATTINKRLGYQSELGYSVISKSSFI